MAELGGTAADPGGKGASGGGSAVAVSSAFADDAAYRSLPASESNATMLAAGRPAAGGDIEMSAVSTDAKGVPGEH